MRRAMPYPCCGPIASSVFSTIRSSVPCRISDLTSLIGRSLFIGFLLTRPREIDGAAGHLAGCLERISIYGAGAGCGNRLLRNLDRKRNLGSLDFTFFDLKLAVVGGQGARECIALLLQRHAHL